MEIVENKSIVWDHIWNNSETLDENVINKLILKSKKSKNWVEYTKLIDKKFGGWKNVNSIEIGSGMGWHSLLAASEGANVTLLDYSELALELAKKRFDLISLKANFLFGNAFEIVESNEANYNLSWSFGTAEHFKDELRQNFFELHFNFIEKNGITIISCPYKYALNYRLWMHYAQKYDKWTFGLEIPYSKHEFLKRLKKSQNSLIKITYNEGRPCLYKMLNILRFNSKIRYYLFLPFVLLVRRFNLKVEPFNLRDIILIAQKS